MWKTIPKYCKMDSMKSPLHAEKSSRALIRRAGDSRSDTVQSLSRALNILNALARHDQGMGLGDVANETSLALSTAHRLLMTLQSENFVRFDPERGVWKVGVQSFIVGSAFLRSRELTNIARPHMFRLMERCGETANLAVEDSGLAVYVAQIECHQVMRAIARPGGRAAMHNSGVGKMLLATMSDQEVKDIIDLHGMTSTTARSHQSFSDLLTDLEAIRERGYAIDDEENSVGLRCVAASIFDEHGHAIASLSVSGPTARIDDELLPILGRDVTEAARKITQELGGKESLR